MDTTPEHRRILIAWSLIVLLAVGMALGTAPASQAATGSSSAAPTAPRAAAPSPAAAQARYRAAGCSTPTAAQLRSGVPVAKCFAVGYTDAAGQQMQADDTPPATALTPSDLVSAYDLPDGGEGVTVAIVDAYGYSAAESDLAVFRSYYGLPACTTASGCFTKVDQRGGTSYPADNGGWSIETALDLDAVSSVCPKCRILLVQGDTAGLDDLGAAVNTAAAWPGVVAISNSYGVDGENAQEAAYDGYYDHPGIAVTVSSGDSGNVQSWPATSPVVTAVGGTRLTRDASTRGWTESAWGSQAGGAGAGSGCSLYEPRPDWQQGVDTTCGEHKGTADIAADADPVSGIGVYNTVGQSGWAQYGGTSLASPLVAGMYALAGTPTPGTYPASYPYAASSTFFDVTSGVNGSCGTKLCQAGTGWDGPTGLGTPHGVSGLAQGRTGEIAGTVTDAGSGHPLPGTTVRAVDPEGSAFTATSGTDGTYDLHAPAGTYTVTASKFGYADRTDQVEVTVGKKADADFTLTGEPDRTVSGTVTDASGHGWPMRTEITVDGAPGAVAYSDPYTGRYSLSLPEGARYTLHATSADLPGYRESDVPLDLTAGTGTVRADVGMKIDGNTCTAPGYAWSLDGSLTDFDGWTGKDPQAGWTVTDAKGKGQTWGFDDPGNRGNRTGGSGNFAVVDSYRYGIGNVQDTSLVSPQEDLSAADNPEIAFDTDYDAAWGQTGSVDVSTDGGQTWTSVWKKTTVGFQGHVDIPIPAAAGHADVRVRFHFTGMWSLFWQLDNVFVGNHSCGPTAGGLMAGVVHDHNTGEPVDGATVAGDSGQFGITAPTPADAGLSDGYYWLFSSHTGTTGFTVKDGKYTPTNAEVDITADGIVRRDFQLRAGHLTVDRSSIAVTEPMGRAKSQQVTFGNDGTAPVHVTLNESDGGFTAMDGRHQAAAPGAPAMVVKAAVSPAAVPGKGQADEGTGGVPADGGAQARPDQAGPAAAGWTPIADYPSKRMDDAVAYREGKVYVVGGSYLTTVSSAANVYDPVSASWKSIAALPEAVHGATADFVGRTLYVVGGWNAAGDVSNHVYSYDADNDRWTRVADLPAGVSVAGHAVLQGRMYIVGGCTTDTCTPAAKSVYSFDPAAGAWTREPSYPTAIAFGACGGVGGEVVCTGGLDANTNAALTATYALVPGASQWVREADLPMDAWGAASAAADGQLQVMGGVIDNSTALTNQAFAYDPARDEWSALPNSTNALFRGAASCGLYRIGGSTGNFYGVASSETLPGYDECGGVGDVSWLNEGTTGFDVAPGQSVTVAVTADSSAVSQPGDYAAAVGVETDTPYQDGRISVAMTVDPPASWGKLTGTVSGSDGQPIRGASVQVCTMWNKNLGCGAVTYSLRTDAAGHYQLWLDKGYNPLALTAGKDGYQPQLRIVRIAKGATTTADFTLPTS
ncbi:carboxypeptidase regulatory-like domain-containing protein [Streptomyces sp. NPDC020917]|uniref:carboxypeptidase regulatory-like domain-containing protein n=1 Tax=Streptomyces sp. NPDC020917 TaxID=3365102 RepID=UPI0037BBE2D2